MTRNIQYKCKTCGSDEITFEATAAWDVDQQALVVSNTYDGCYCNSEDCQGEERDVQEHDAETGEALARAPGSFDYIPKLQADAAWAKYHAERQAERVLQDRDRQQEHVIASNTEVLEAAFLEMEA